LWTVASKFDNPTSTIDIRSGRCNFNECRLFISKRQAVASQAELDRIAHRRSADDFNVRPIAEAHLQQTTLEFAIASHGNDSPAPADTKIVQTTGLD
jgi:hypothetical protein